MEHFEPSRRFRRLPRQLFAALIAATEARRAAGHDVINLGQGNPVDPTPEHIVRAMQEAVADPVLQRYIPFDGLPAFKEAAARWWGRRYGVDVDPATEVAVMIGVKVGLVEMSLLVANPGDKVAVPDPGYPDYWSGIALAGAELVPIPLRPERDYYPDWDALPSDVKLVFLNYPHNPTGQVATPAVFEQAVAFARRTGAVLVHDLAYGDIMFDGRPSRSFLATPGAKDVGLEFVSLSKSYNMAGWRIGVAAGNREVIHALEVLQDHLHCSQFGAIQVASIAALDSPPEITERVARTYQERRDVFVGALDAAGWHIPPAAGGIFLWCPVPGGGDGEAFANFLLERADVVTAPGRGFGEEGRRFIRVALTQPTDRIAEAARRIAKVLPEWLDLVGGDPRAMIPKDVPAHSTSAR